MKQLYDPHDVLCAATAEEAREYIGQEGYFADTRAFLDSHISHGWMSKLEAVEDGSEIFPFRYRRDGDLFTWASLFLPACKVKNAEDSNE